MAAIFEIDHVSKMFKKGKNKPIETFILISKQAKLLVC